MQFREMSRPHLEIGNPSQCAPRGVFMGSRAPRPLSLTQSPPPSSRAAPSPLLTQPSRRGRQIGASIRRSLRQPWEGARRTSDATAAACQGSSHCRRRAVQHGGVLEAAATLPIPASAVLYGTGPVRYASRFRIRAAVRSGFLAPAANARGLGRGRGAGIECGRRSLGCTFNG